MTAKEKRYVKDCDLYFRLISEQLKWIAEHGASLAGYRANYDAPDDTERGTLIYQADVGELLRLQEAFARINQRHFT